MCCYPAFIEEAAKGGRGCGQLRNRSLAIGDRGGDYPEARTHTLQLLLGDKDHIPHNPPVMPPRIRVVVTVERTAPREAASQAPTRRRPGDRIGGCSHL